ncbi:hypothetical protein L1049_024773 [Liquidambar formosana]|uniref:F-box domain-containing protein n=1 Tax=Liquidambar formosana TaxID=63359 RepID=A0AAP0X527_LIQFO
MEEQSNGGEDSTKIRSLNDCPEDVLLHILSFLPTIDAVRTSLLSRKWRNLWSSIPSLYFSYDLFPPSSSPSATCRSFADSVDRTLILRYPHSPILKLRLDFDFKDYLYTSHIDSWIRYAINHNAVELDLDFFIDRKYHTVETQHFSYDFPFAALRTGRVRVLKLCHCDLYLPNNMPTEPFPSLRSIFLDQIPLTDEMVSDLIIGCPNLESLTLEHCYAMKDLKIRGSKIKELYLRYFYCDEASLEIACPNLRLLNMKAFEVGKYSLKNSSALVEAYVFFLHKMDCYVYWSKVVRLLGHVKLLSVQNWWFKLLAPKDAIPGSFVLKNLTYLELQTGYSDSDLLGMAALFELAPNLDTMILDYLYKISNDESVPEECLNKPINFCLPRLRQVKINDFRRTKSQMHFLDLLKVQGVALKKIVLVIPKVGDTSYPPIVLVRHPRGVKVVEQSSTKLEE